MKGEEDAAIDAAAVAEADLYDALWDVFEAVLSLRHLRGPGHTGDARHLAHRLRGEAIKYAALTAYGFEVDSGAADPKPAAWHVERLEAMCAQAAIDRAAARERQGGPT